VIGSFQIQFPIRYQIAVTKLRQQLDEAHLAWAKEWKQRQDDFVIENIRFTHDPLWNKRFFSIQAAHDGEIWFWRAAQIFVGFELTSI
jgi:hypothetical protein